jgi:UPF0755 protein
MEPPEQKLEQLFDKGYGLLERTSLRWRAHTNRRTTLAVIVVGAIGIFSYLYLIRPPDAFPVEHLVNVPAGIPLSSIGSLLEEGQVVRSGLAFDLLVTVMGHERDVHAGDYLFKEPQDVFSVARAISLGVYGLEPMRIRIPEGAMIKDMALIFDKRLERFDEVSFLEQALPDEGYLFPDTYFFLPNATEETVLLAMRQNFEQHIATIAPQIASSTHSLSDIVTMASIVEREARNSKDRGIIAGVLWNRLARGMALQVDVTFLYTIGKGTFDLTMADLTSDSPYNTYKNKGLPPTPIGSPSLDSLLAAAVPTKNNYLYFLADGNGVTHFCKTYACQVANKAKYF